MDKAKNLKKYMELVENLEQCEIALKVAKQSLKSFHGNLSAKRLMNKGE